MGSKARRDALLVVLLLAVIAGAGGLITTQPSTLPPASSPPLPSETPVEVAFRSPGYDCITVLTSPEFVITDPHRISVCMDFLVGSTAGAAWHPAQPQERGFELAFEFKSRSRQLFFLLQVGGPEPRGAYLDTGEGPMKFRQLSRTDVARLFDLLGVEWDNEKLRVIPTPRPPADVRR